MSETTGSPSIRRREFIAGAVTAAAFTLVRPAALRAQGANGKLQLGLIGCGNRGLWIGGLFEENTNTKVVALHDYFQDRVDMGRDRFEVDPRNCFTGLSGYKALLECDVDAVAIESPPFFHPAQAEAAVNAGKHVYVAKPIALDVPGCRTIQESADKAKGRGLSFLVDFQSRNNSIYREAVQRVRNGEIGKIVCGEAHYHCGMNPQRAEPGNPESRLRNWLWDYELSGDIIVEQNIHVIDIATWFINEQPTRAYGTGGRGAREIGTCWDHYVVTYWFPNDVVLDFSSTQFLRGYSDLGNRMYGSEGTVETHYGGDVWLDNGTRWEGGSTGPIYSEGAVNNMKDFCAGIDSGQIVNTADDSVRSNLTSILGRTAARHGELVTWDEMMDDAEEVDGGLEGLKD